MMRTAQIFFLKLLIFHLYLLSVGCSSTDWMGLEKFAGIPEYENSGEITGKYAKCGNGKINKAEECDDGNRRVSDGCDQHCIIEICGNGKIQYGEECDDGNILSGDGCSSTCKKEP